ncbi:MAG TPA: winged helix-turn-helix transcriptional regulator [Thermoanaerobaculia bacterium]|nr:winged helix-turn-helix transcriptional regulator [Thermoanaerobaculia bacterium]
MATRELSPVDLLPDARRALLLALKQAGRATIPRLAEILAISTEAVRQQLSFLQRQGWVVADCGPDDDDGRVPGRPPAEYCLAPLADDLFPKSYAQLAVALFDELPNAERTLETITDRTVDALREAISPDSIARDVGALRSIYRPNDPYTDVEKSERGYRLIERNCPYLQFATERPLFCSTTVSALRRLTNGEVVREERFQDGDGRCVFHMYLDAPVSTARKTRRFEREPAKDARPPRSR